MAQGSQSGLTALGLQTPYRDVLIEILTLQPDTKSVYKAWLSADNEFHNHSINSDNLVPRLIWSRHLSLSVNEQKKLAARYWLWTIVVEFGHLTMAMEGKLADQIERATSSELQQILTKYLTSNSEGRLTILSEMEIDINPAINLSLLDTLVAHQLAPSLLTAFPGLARKLRCHQTMSLDYLLHYVIQHAKDDRTCLLAIEVAKAHLHQQLTEQLFFIPRDLVNQLPLIFSATPSEATFSKQVKTFLFHIVIGGNTGKVVKVSLPACFVLSEQFLEQVKVLLLTYWATVRVAWLLLGVAKLGSAHVYMTEGLLARSVTQGPAVSDSQRVIYNMLEHSLDQLCNQNEQCSFAKLLRHDIETCLTQKLFNRANSDQLEALQRIRTTKPNQFRRALEFGPGTVACRITLQKACVKSSADYQTLRQFQ